MKYKNIVKAEFIERFNRFVAAVLIDGEEVSVHVKNTGRCRELLLPGATVYLEDFTWRMGTRKLRYDLIAVEKGNILINMDSQVPNKVVGEALADGRILLPRMGELVEIHAERVYGNSRFDFYIRDKNGREAFIEVKGVTLENDGIVSFPDAPTERGIKHLHELVAAKCSGYEAYAVFVVQMSGMKYFTPNDERHEAFGEALRFAAASGVEILAYECDITPDSIEVTNHLPVHLS